MEEENQFTRLRRLLGDEGLARLQDACVMVVGIGGVGSSCAEALVRGGVGHLIFVDGDAVAPSNINRQALAFQSTVGQRKVDVMRAMAADINPQARVETVDAFLLPEDVAGLFATVSRPDYVVDAIDTVSTKIALAQHCQQAGIPEVASMGGANKQDPTTLRFADIYQTKVDPLARSFRKLARQAGIDQLEVLYSDEPPTPVARTEGEGRTELGTMSYFPPIMGQMLASWVIRKILGQ